MTKFEPAFARPYGGEGPKLLAALVISLALAVLPAAWVAPLKDLVRLAVTPGLRLVRATTEAGRHVAQRAGAVRRSTDELVQLRIERGRLQEENRRLRRAAATRLNLDRASQIDPLVSETEPLLHVQIVEARLLGRQARRFLASAAIIDVGLPSGVTDGDLVLDDLPLIDRGVDSGLRPRDLLLSGSAVWGRLVEVGRWTSLARPLGDPGYRDVVRLAQPTGDGLIPGPQGVLEGTGEANCRIRMVDASEPVAVGNVVMAADSEGLLSHPLLYGTVVRARRAPGGTQWEIWMKPAAKPPIGRVGVVSLKLNRQSVAANRGADVILAGRNDGSRSDVSESGLAGRRGHVTSRANSFSTPEHHEP